MILVDLPDGNGSALVRGLAACLSSVTEVPLDELPDVGEVPVEHAISAWKSWLAGRGSGLVPIADPRSFQWAGWWIAVAHHPAGPAGPVGPMAVLAFGTPPGIVLSPQDPSLLGTATADLDISSAWAAASLDPVLPPAAAGSALSGVVELLAVAPQAEAPMRLVRSARAVAGHGLEGDRYAFGAGTFSRGARRSGYDLTLIASEALEELTVGEAGPDFASTRRNVLTRGIDVNALVGREFTIDDVRCRGLRLAEPCAHLERLAGPGLLRTLIHRGGLRADVLSNGLISLGSTITT